MSRLRFSNLSATEISIFYIFYLYTSEHSMMIRMRCCF